LGLHQLYGLHGVCPVAIEHVSKINEMRRYLVLMESNFPAEVQTVFKGMETNSNPWGIGMSTRADWAKNLGVKTLAEDSDVDILFYVGCSGAFDDRYKKCPLLWSRFFKQQESNLVFWEPRKDVAGIQLDALVMSTFIR